MTRVAVMVSMWLLLIGGIGDAVAVGSRHSQLELAGLAGAVTLLTWAALWLQFQPDEGQSRPAMLPPRRARWHLG